MKVAVVQLSSRSSVSDNLSNVEKWLAKAASQGAKLAVLPENFAYWGDNSFDLAQDNSDPEGHVRACIRRLAQQFDMWIVAGTLPQAQPFYSTEKTTDVVSTPLEPAIDTTDPHKVFAASLLFDNLGRELARYDKIHLFDADVKDNQGGYRESERFHAGYQQVVVHTPYGALGLSVCYDLRFPELYLNLAQQGAQMLAVPAAFTAVTGDAHWSTLLRARAIENQCYVLAANQTGHHEDGRETFGHSQIIDPWGRVLSEVESGEGVALAEVDLIELAKVRSNMPVMQHRKLSFVPEKSE